MTNIEAALKHIDEIFDAAPWLREDIHADSRVPGALNLTWGDLVAVRSVAGENRCLQSRIASQRHELARLNAVSSSALPVKES